MQSITSEQLKTLRDHKNIPFVKQYPSGMISHESVDIFIRTADARGLCYVITVNPDGDGVKSFISGEAESNDKEHETTQDAIDVIIAVADQQPDE